jgi:hypothetical protein
MITPIILEALFWLGVTACVIAGFVILYTANTGGYAHPTSRAILGILLIFVGPLLVRIYVELLILFFRMNESLTDVRNHLLRQASDQEPDVPEIPGPS